MATLITGVEGVTGVDQRFRTGEVCLETGTYEFDGYVNGSSDGLPFSDELEIAILAGAPFPPIQSRNRACFWQRTPGDALEAYVAVCGP